MTGSTAKAPAPSGPKEVPVLEGLFHRSSGPGDKAYLIGSKCSACGYIAFPKRVVCPACVRENTMEEIPLGTRGKVFSFTVARVAPPGFTAPYLQSWIDLPEGPRIFSLISGVEPRDDALVEGQEVELAIEKIRTDDEGNAVIGYTFRPMSKGGKS
ncbi:MAG: Zn-ribbon domain-containing OB-fold protein [Chloroflexi bacterium]|nr:Zn-ribbon domain-containing OB-fold protein [Chloroflexota bacterium]